MFNYFRQYERCPSWICVILTFCLIIFPIAAWAHDKDEPSLKIGVLLPLSGQYEDEGKILLSGVRLAALDPQTHQFVLALDIHDINAEGAYVAAQKAVQNKDKVIVGPLTRGQTSDVASVASDAKIPVLSFTSDERQRGDLIWVLGLTPHQQVQQLVLQAQTEGRRHFAAFLPQTALGHAMGESLQDVCRSQQLPDPKIAYHGPLDGDITSYLSDLGIAFVHPQLPQAVTQERLSAEPSQQTNSPPPAQVPHTVPPPPTLPQGSSDALLMADTRKSLALVAHALAENSVHLPGVRLLGPALWSSLDAQLDGLSGGWYTTFDPRPRQSFIHYYMTYEHRIPDPLADLSFDGTTIVKNILLANNGHLPLDMLMRKEGFVGAQGHITFLEHAKIHRDLSIFEIVGNGHMPRMVAISREQ